MSLIIGPTTLQTQTLTFQSLHMDDKYSTNGGAAAAAASSSAVVDETLSSSGMRVADTLLRLASMGLCVAALIVMLKNSQTDDYGSVAYSDLGAFKYGNPFSSFF